MERSIKASAVVPVVLSSTVCPKAALREHSLAKVRIAELEDFRDALWLCGFRTFEKVAPLSSMFCPWRRRSASMQLAVEPRRRPLHHGRRFLCQSESPSNTAGPVLKTKFPRFNFDIFWQEREELSEKQTGLRNELKA